MSKRYSKKQIRKYYFFISVFLFCSTIWSMTQAPRANAKGTSLANTIQSVSLSRCIDGDTAAFIVDTKQVTVRFSGVNTPEYSKSKKEVLGKEAATFTCEALQQSKQLDIVWDRTQSESYKRKIGIVFVDQQNLNVLLLKQGLADLRYLRDQMPYAAEYRTALEQAKQANIGLWQKSSA